MPTSHQQTSRSEPQAAGNGHGDTSWFVRDRFGLFIHWGLYALPARHEWVKHREELSDADYQRYFEHFNPDLYDPRAWARTAARAGMKYCVVTTKHHDGFCLWDSQHTDYKATRTPCGRDLIAPLVEAFREEGLRIGFYYSLIDWHHPDFPVDRFHPQRNDTAFRQAAAGRDVGRYAEYLRAQVRELLTRYGKIDLLFFDFSYPGDDGKGRADWQSEKLVEMIRGLHPDILINDRLDFPESADYRTPEQYVPNEGVKDEAGRAVVWEACHTFSGSWGYHRDEASWKSVPLLVRMLVEHTAKGGNLLLNVGPTGRGTLDQRAVERLRGLGAWMQLHNRSIYGCTAAPAEWVPPADCRYTFNPETRRLYVHCAAWPFRFLHLPALAGKIAYAQLLNDASELKFHETAAALHAALKAGAPRDALTLELPVLQPDPVLPVIELFLK
ncbi:MAG: alpha-L-fucosidase [Lentisphaerae bacterium]|nr:alpha-L-fucosidase [Lentisphaerota bacterium]